ncbi:MAG: hypothetical protein ABI454_02760 [Sphingomicrobium sp.]
MSRFEIRTEVSQSGLGPPAPRGALGLAVMITCAVAALSFAVGLIR